MIHYQIVISKNKTFYNIVAKIHEFYETKGIFLIYFLTQTLKKLFFRHFEHPLDGTAGGFHQLLVHEQLWLFGFQGR